MNKLMNIMTLYCFVATVIIKCLFVCFVFALLGEENKFMLLYTMSHGKSNTGLNVIFVYLKKNYLTATQ